MEVHFNSSEQLPKVRSVDLDVPHKKTITLCHQALERTRKRNPCTTLTKIAALTATMNLSASSMMTTKNLNLTEMRTTMLIQTSSLVHCDIFTTIKLTHGVGPPMDRRWWTSTTPHHRDSSSSCACCTGSKFEHAFYHSPEDLQVT